MKKLALAIVALLLIAAVAFGVRTFGARNETDKVTSSDAAKVVKDTTTDTTADSQDSIEPGERPKPGTYTYTGSGSDSVSTLGGSTHTYPAEVGAVVALDSTDDCAWTMDLVFVKQHIEHRAYCTANGTVTDHGFERTISFFNQTERNAFTCGDDALRLKTDATAGDSWAWTCHNGDKTTSRYTLTVVGIENIKVGTDSVKTWHTRIVSKQSGDTRGSDVSESWTAASGLPVKFTSNLNVQTKSVLGDTNYKEHATYQLRSLVPSSG